MLQSGCSTRAYWATRVSGTAGAGLHGIPVWRGRIKASPILCAASGSKIADARSAVRTLYRLCRLADVNAAVLGEFIDAAGVGQLLELVEKPDGGGFKIRFGRIESGEQRIDFDAGNA